MLEAHCNHQAVKTCNSRVPWMPVCCLQRVNPAFFELQRVAHSSGVNVALALFFF